MCTLVLKETLADDVGDESTVSCSFLDANKAFDRVHYCKLFRLLVDHGIPPYILCKYCEDYNESLCWTCNKGYVE